MKRFFLLMLTAVLVSCGGAKEEAGPAKAAAPGQVNIYIWTNYLPQEVIT